MPPKVPEKKETLKIEESKQESPSKQE